MGIESQGSRPWQCICNVLQTESGNFGTCQTLFSHFHHISIVYLSKILQKDKCFIQKTAKVLKRKTGSCSTANPHLFKYSWFFFLGVILMIVRKRLLLVMDWFYVIYYFSVSLTYWLLIYSDNLKCVKKLWQERMMRSHSCVLFTPARVPSHWNLVSPILQVLLPHQL